MIVLHRRVLYIHSQKIHYTKLQKYPNESYRPDIERVKIR